MKKKKRNVTSLYANTMRPSLCRTAWKVKVPRLTLSWRWIRFHWTTNAVPIMHIYLLWILYSRPTNKTPQLADVSLSVCLTIIRVKHSRVLGQTWVKVSHQRGDVLSGCEHSMDYISSVKETCERKKHAVIAITHLYAMQEDIHSMYFHHGRPMGQRTHPTTPTYPHTQTTSLTVISHLLRGIFAG